MDGAVDVRWAWVFLDLPEDGFLEAAEFWRSVTRTRFSPWRGERGEFVTLLPASGDPWVKVQRVGGRGGVHLDLDVAGPLDEAAARAVALGAAVLDDRDDVVVCSSPGGLAFCLCPAGREGAPSHQDRVGASSLLDQVCLDVPRACYDAERAFWSRLTGWRVVPGRVRDEFERLAVPADLPLTLLLQRLDDVEGEVRAHVDLSSLDRATEVGRHVALGATEVAPGRGWTVLAGPSGPRYCVTDRLPGVDPVGGRA